MQFSLFYLRLTETWHSLLAPAEVLHRLTQATVPTNAASGRPPHEPAQLLQGWVIADSFRISLLSQGHRQQSSVVVEGKLVAGNAGGSQLRLLYRPLLMHLFVLGFWLIFFGTLALAALLEWLRGPEPFLSWQTVAVPWVIYGLVVFLFWRRARQSRRQLVSLLDLARLAAPLAS